MRNYEVTVIFPDNSEKLATGKEIIKGEFDKHNVEIVKEEDAGVKILAYEVKKEEKGHFYFYDVKMEPQNVAEIDASLRLKDEILKFLFIAADE